MAAPFSSSTAPAGWTTPEKIIGVVITVLTLAVSAAASFATANSQLAQKIDRSEYQHDASEIDRRITRDSVQHAVEAERMYRMEAGIDSANTRLRQIWCEGKSPSCR